MDHLYLNADTEVFYDDAQSQDGTALTSLTVTYEVLSSSGASLDPAVTGTCSHVSGGDYVGVVASTTATTATFTEGGRYLVAFTATGGGYDDYRRIPVMACYRGVG